MGEHKRPKPVTARELAERTAIKILFGDNPNKATADKIPDDAVFSVTFPQMVEPIVWALIRHGFDEATETETMQ